jgi:asparagine synthase (glutamine-hydrolysing)
MNKIEKMLYLDAKIYMQDLILVKVDRASMAVGLEVRAPFLDFEVAEFLARLPLNYKLNGFTTKFLLKRAVKKILPKKVINRRKKGFTIPARNWLQNEFQYLMEEMFSHERLKKAGFFDPKYIRILLDDHRAGRRNNQKLLWTLLMFELWYENYI